MSGPRKYSIGDLIENAINTGDFSSLSEKISKTINDAVSNGSQTIRSTVNDAVTNGTKTIRGAFDAEPPIVRHTASSRQNSHTAAVVTVEDAQSPELYRSAGGKKAGGIIQTVFGGISLLACFGTSLASDILAGIGGVNPVVTFLSDASDLFAAAGIILLICGILSIKRVNRYRSYLRVLGSKTFIPLKELAFRVGKKERFVRKEIKKMIGQGLFLQGHLDKEGKTLITSDETYELYLRSLQTQNQKQAKENSKLREPAPASQDVLDKGNAFLLEIRRCNAQIPGSVMTDKISRMEMLIERIFQRAQDHPEIVPDLKKLMDYYLPMTVKLLTAYAEMDRQPIQGETIVNSKKEIEATLDTLIVAFEKLLDSIFKETALDISSDITVLQSLLAQEGLTDDGLAVLRNSQK